MSKKNSVLLASAAAGGTIAATRDLGMRGFDVGVVSSRRFGAAAWSRYATRVYSAPPESQGQEFLERLLTIGAADPGRILLPTSDETAWMYAHNAASLKRYFILYQPPTESLQRILDKRLLSDAATAAGLDVLPSWDPRSIDDVIALAPSLPYPVLIKPRTHVHRLRNDKGELASSAAELISKYLRVVEREKASAAFNPRQLHASMPILQQFVRVGSEGVYSVTGFVDRSGDLFVTRAATKVFQRSQPVGVGVCFEALPSDQAMSDSVRRLCKELGYFGMFEVEFLRLGNRWAVIDFNPRLFNQVGLDIHRGMPLPLLACLDAVGDTAELREAVALAQSEDGKLGVFYDRFTLRAILLAQALTARGSNEERAYWRAWMKRHASNSTDLVADNGDPVPGVVHAFSEIYLGLKSFRRFVQSTPPASYAGSGLLKKEPS